MSAQLAARVFAVLIAAVVAFQLALALGAPWGALAMGGAFPGVLPAPMRLGALVQAAVLAGCSLVMLSRAGLVLPGWRALSRPLAWGVTVLLAIALVLNLITPSGLERLIWAPVALGLLLTALRVAASR